MAVEPCAFCSFVCYSLCIHMVFVSLLLVSVLFVTCMCACVCTLLYLRMFTCLLALKKCSI